MRSVWPASMANMTWAIALSWFTRPGELPLNYVRRSSLQITSD